MMRTSRYWKSLNGDFSISSWGTPQKNFTFINHIFHQISPFRCFNSQPIIVLSSISIIQSSLLSYLPLTLQFSIINILFVHQKLRSYQPCNISLEESNLENIDLVIQNIFIITLYQPYKCLLYIVIPVELLLTLRMFFSNDAQFTINESPSPDSFVI